MDAASLRSRGTQPGAADSGPASAPGAQGHQKVKSHSFKPFPAPSVPTFPLVLTGLRSPMAYGWTVPHPSGLP